MPLDGPFPVPLPDLLCDELLLPNPNQESPEVPLLVELEDEEFFTFAVGLLELVPLELKFGLNPVVPEDDRGVDEPFPISVGLFEPVTLEPILGFDPVDPGLLYPNPLELLDPDEKRDVLEDPTPLDTGLLNTDPVELLNPVDNRLEPEEPVPVDPGLLNVDPDKP